MAIPSLTHSGTGASRRCMPQLKAIWWVASCTSVETSPAAAGHAGQRPACLPRWADRGAACRGRCALTWLLAREADAGRVAEEVDALVEVGAERVLLLGVLRLGAGEVERGHAVGEQVVIADDPVGSAAEVAGGVGLVGSTVSENHHD